MFVPIFNCTFRLICLTSWCPSWPSRNPYTGVASAHWCVPLIAYHVSFFGLETWELLINLQLGLLYINAGLCSVCKALVPSVDLKAACDTLGAACGFLEFFLPWAKMAKWLKCNDFHPHCAHCDGRVPPKAPLVELRLLRPIFLFLLVQHLSFYLFLFLFFLFFIFFYFFNLFSTSCNFLTVRDTPYGEKFEFFSKYCFW